LVGTAGRAHVAFGVLSVAYAGWAVVAAGRRLLWFDELFTVAVADTGGLGAIVSHLRQGMDTHPPLFYWLSRLCSLLLGPGAVGHRIPSIVGLWGALAAVYWLGCRQRRPELGLIGCCLLLTTPALAYAIEARPYALLVGLAAVVFMLWLAAGEHVGWRRSVSLACLWTALTAALWLHYYAVLLLLPLALGELARRIRTGRFDRGRCLVLVASALNLFPLVAFVRGSALRFVATFWAVPGRPVEIARAYQTLFGPTLTVSFLAGLATWALPRAGRWRSSEEDRAPALASEHWVAGAAFALLPLVTWVAAKLFTNAFAPKYALASVAGVIVIVAMAPTLIPASQTWTQRLAVALLCLVPALELPSIGAAFGDPSWSTIRDRDDFLEDLVNQYDATAVFDSALQFLPAYHYARPEVRDGFRYAVDSSAGRFAGNDTLGRAMKELQRHVDVHTVEYRDLITPGRRLLIVSPVAGAEAFWLVPRLVQQGQRLTLVGRRSGLAVYLLEVDERPTQSPPAGE
jgi:hypothetical protein